MHIRTNPDKKLVSEIRKKLKENGGYCPCSLIKDEDHKCICKEFMDQDSGLCHCGLYEKLEK